MLTITTRSISEEINRRPGNVALFCGAGISFDSGLPLANDIINEITNNLNMLELDKNDYLAQDYPFEGTMQVLLNHSDIKHLLEVFAGDTPNLNHYFIAQLCQKKLISTVATTNFDCLVEKAMVDIHPYAVIHRESQFQIIDSMNKNGNTILLKLHGSLHDPESIRITLQDVSSGVLTKKRSQALDYFFSEGPHDSVLILGYSCSDVFDILPQVQAIKNKNKKILFVSHCNDGDRVNDSRMHKVRDMFNGYPLGILHADTCLLVRDLSRDLNLSARKATKGTSNIKWHEAVSKWASSVTNKGSVCADLFLKIGDKEKALFYYQAGAKEGWQLHELRNPTGPGLTLKNVEKVFRGIKVSPEFSKGIGNIYLELLHQEAIQVSVNESIDDAKKLIEYRDTETPVFQKQAIECYTKLLVVARELGNLEKAYFALTSLSLLFVIAHDFNQALNYSREALHVSKDKKDQLETLLELARIKKYQSHKPAAEKYYIEAQMLAKEINESATEAVILQELGGLCLPENYIKAKKYYEKGMILAALHGFLEIEMHIANELSRINLEQDTKENAIDMAERALCLAEHLNSKEQALIALVNLGFAYELAQNNVKAKESAYEAVVLAKDLGDTKSQHFAESTFVNATLQIGHETLKSKRFYEAVENLESTLPYLESCDTKKTMGVYLGLITGYFVIGKYEEAIEQYTILDRKFRGDEKFDSIKSVPLSLKEQAEEKLQELENQKAKILEQKAHGNLDGEIEAQTLLFAMHARNGAFLKAAIEARKTRSLIVMNQGKWNLKVVEELVQFFEQKANEQGAKLFP